MRDSGEHKRKLKYTRERRTATERDGDTTVVEKCVPA